MPFWNANYRDDGAAACIFANSLWLSNRVSYKEEPFRILAKDYYASAFTGEMGSREFNEKQREWINKETGGLLREQAENLSMPPETILTLLNTVYLYSEWDDMFLKENTAPRAFHGEQGDRTADFMYQFSDFDDYFWGENFGAVRKPLKNGMGDMWFLLPREGMTAEELLQDEEAMTFLLTADRADSWEKQKEAGVHLYLPKFDVTAELDILGGLRALGITQVMDPDTADYTPILQRKDAQCCLGKASHSVRVKVDERGVEATAFTVIENSNPTSGPCESLPEMDFILDRPFLFAITSATVYDGNTVEMPLFSGIVRKPLPSELG